MSNPLFAGRLPGRIDSFRIVVVSDDDAEAIAAGVPAVVLEALGEHDEVTTTTVVSGSDLYIRASLWPALKAELEQLPARN